MKYNNLLIPLFLYIQNIYCHGIDNNDDEDEEHEKQYPTYVTVIGILCILCCSFLGTVLPIVFKKTAFFKEDTLFFKCIKLFGTGIILGTALIHMVIPASQILTSKYTYKIFNESYTSFTGVFVILGIAVTHLIQTYTGHFLTKNSGSHKGSEGSDITIEVDDKKEEMDITHDKNHYHEKNSRTEPVSTVDDCVENHHGLLHLMEHKEKQIICYLLEIGISLHSALIGTAFGMTSDSELIALMIALVFHQFFEGVSLSSVFIEAHFKHSFSIICMIITYTCTLPIGAMIGLIIRSVVESTDRVYLTFQGIIDAIAGGILIYDDLVNILSRHCNSELFKNCSFFSKNIQLLSFYIGITVMGIIGIWA